MSIICNNMIWKISNNMDMKFWVSKAYTLSIIGSRHNKDLIDWYITQYKCYKELKELTQ